MAAYCTPDSLENHLGRPLTSGESDAAPLACLASTDFIDRFTGKSWQGTTISGELQTVLAPTVRLDRTPVASVTTVTARSLTVGETPRVLLAGSGYELLDAPNGILLVSEARGTVLTVTYVVGAVVPPSISKAADIIAATYAVAVSAASGKGRGILKLEAGSTAITYDPIEKTVAIPSTALDLLALHRPAVMFA